MAAAMPDVLSPTPDQRPPRQNPERPNPDDRRQARRNHRWMLLMAMTPVVFGILYALGVFTHGDPEPVVDPVRVPAGYTAVTDAYFGFSLPTAWKQNSAFSDSDGDFYYNGPGGWAGENESIAKVSPTPSTPVPESLKSFDTAVPTGFTLVGGHRITVPGTTFAWAVTLTRPGGFRAEAVDVWEAHSQTELWLMVNSSPATDATVVSSLNGSAVN
jgi:hypothetical protein